MHNYEIVVVTSAKRRALILPHLEGVEHKISVTPDYDLHAYFVPGVTGLTHNHVGTYRCFRGHQDAIAKATADNVLIFEDDAIPKNNQWVEVVEKVIEKISEYDLISLHGRAYKLSDFTSIDHGIIKPKSPDKWVVAALAYIVNRRSYSKLLNFKYISL